MTFYPPAALRAHASGTVTMSFRIGTDGTVRAVALTKSSGNSALDGAALKCVSSWLYKPASRDGQPVEVPWSVTVSFNIENSFPPPGMTLAPKRLDSNDCPHDSISKLPEESTEVSFTVGANGRVKNVSVAKSSGDTALDQIGVDCVTKWRFSPASRDGQPVEVKGSTKFDWKE
jgi:TonB family protein